MESNTSSKTSSPMVKINLIDLRLKYKMDTGNYPIHDITNFFPEDAYSERTADQDYFKWVEEQLLNVINSCHVIQSKHFNCNRG